MTGTVFFGTVWQINRDVDTVLDHSTCMTCMYMYVHVYCVRVRLCTYYNVLYIYTPTPTCTYFDIQIAASSHHLQHVEPESHPFAPSTKQRHIHRVASRAEPLVQDGINPELDPGSM